MNKAPNRMSCARESQPIERRSRGGSASDKIVYGVAPFVGQIIVADAGLTRAKGDASQPTPPDVIGRRRQPRVSRNIRIRSGGCDNVKEFISRFRQSYHNTREIAATYRGLTH